MSFDKFAEEWGKLVVDSLPKVAKFCGLPDPHKLKQALDTHDIVIILFYRSFGGSGRKLKWQKDRTCYLDQYWRRVWVKIGEIDKNRINVFCLPMPKIEQAPMLLDAIVNGRFKNTSNSVSNSGSGSATVDFEFWYPPAGFDKGIIDGSLPTDTV